MKQRLRPFFAGGKDYAFSDRFHSLVSYYDYTTDPVLTRRQEVEIRVDPTLRYTFLFR